MKEVWQEMGSGRTVVADVPAPMVQPGRVLIQVCASAVSAGTERMVVEFASRSLLSKARARPDLVRQVVGKARREGVLTAIEAVQRRLDQPMPLGYSVAGVVIAVGSGVEGIAVGDHVAGAGAGVALHAEVVSVPKNLVAQLPKGVQFEAAAFSTLGAIALHGVRLAEIQVGSCVAVLGLGLLGQITVQLLRAAGCRVVGFDPNPSRASLAEKSGADAVASADEAFAELCRIHTAGVGADAVLITADTASDEPVALAATVARGRAVVVAVGAVGMTLPRKAYFEKELVFRVSRSYGPGRYDPSYEEHGHDYPIEYVRWTEQRNMQAFVDLLASGSVSTAPLVTHRFDIADAEQAYELISGKTSESFLGVILTYSGREDARQATVALSHESSRRPDASEVSIGLIGAGNFPNATFLPAMKRDKGTRFVGVCAASGLSAHYAGRRFKFQYATTDERRVLGDAGVNAVVIATRHHLHAAQVVLALEAGKHVFVEKPLCLNAEELGTIIEAYRRCDDRLLMVGFNRRFAPLAQRLKAFFAVVREPLAIHYRINAGWLPPDHWTHDPEQGGGRIVGEAVHFLDFAAWMAGAAPVRVEANSLPDSGRYRGDNVAMTVHFGNGTLAQILYLANGDGAVGKERVEVHGGGRSGVLDDFRRLELSSGGVRNVSRTWLRQDKGHAAEWAAFAAAVRTGGPAPIPFGEVVSSMRTAFAARDSLGSGRSAVLDAD